MAEEVKETKKYYNNRSERVGRVCRTLQRYVHILSALSNNK